MAFPFGGHIRFSEYIQWAREQGCTVQSGVGTGSSVGLTRIEAPDGKWVIEGGTRQDEFLMPTTIGRLDRRLGLTSPFFSLDGAAADEAETKEPMQH